MTNGRNVLWVVGGVLALLFPAAMSTPSLLRSRMAANESSLVARSRSVQGTEQSDVLLQVGQLALYANVEAPDKKLIHNAELGLMVENVRSAAERIRSLAESNHGEIDKLEIIESGSGSLSAAVVVRVPASGLENALAEFKKVAVRIEREQASTLDVTREFFDNEAHMNNLHAEEQQYLAIMKQAHTVKDTLEVSEKLSNVRDRIERLQEQIQLMTHDIQMSAVTIALMQESDAQVFGVRWRPLYNAKIALRQLLVGLRDWLDWVVEILIKLPLMALWAVTVAGILWIFWRVGRSVWRRFLKPGAASE